MRTGLFRKSVTKIFIKIKTLTRTQILKPGHLRDPPLCSFSPFPSALPLEKLAPDPLGVGVGKGGVRVFTHHHLRFPASDSTRIKHAFIIQPVSAFWLGGDRQQEPQTQLTSGFTYSLSPLLSTW